MEELDNKKAQETVTEECANDNSDAKEKESELAERLFELIKSDDVDLFVKELEKAPSILGCKLGVLPLASVCALFNAEKLLSKLTAPFVETNTFTDLVAPKEVYEKLCECLMGFEELYQNVRFIEPSEILLLKRDSKAFKSFLKRGGIKTLSSRKRIEKILDSIYSGYTIKANGDYYCVIPPKTPQRKAFYAVSIIAIAVIIILSIVLPLTLRVNVTYYCLGEEYGTESGLTGKNITIQNPEREGYIFLGWFTDEECAENNVKKLKIGVEKLYAGWQLAEYKVTLRSDYDDFDGKNEKVLIHSILSEEELPILCREGYLFIGWFDSDGKRVNSTETDMDITLTARYKALSESGSYEISEGEDFLYLSQLKDTTVELVGDITLGSDFLSTGYMDDLSVDGYSGLNIPFNGNGHKIIFDDVVLPLFLVIGENGSVKDLHIECSSSPDSSLSLTVFGLVTSINRGNIESIIVSFSNDGQLIQNTSGSMMGLGIIVGNNLGIVRGCKTEGDIQIMASGSLVAGGIVGVNGNELTSGIISECTNGLTIKSSVSMGGICGLSFSQIKDSNNNGSLTISRGGTTMTTCFLGGICADSRGEIQGCVNNACLNGEANQIALCIGGIVGLTTGSVNNCKNLNDLTIERCDHYFYLGGISGNVYSEDKEASISLSRNEGNLDSNGSSSGWIGGISARASGSVEEDVTYYAVIDKCVNVGNILDGWATGGLVGTSYLSKISYSRNEGKVNAECVRYDSTCYAGGLVADSEKCEISNCISIGDVSCSLNRNEDVALTKYANIGGLIGNMINTEVNNCVKACKVLQSTSELMRCGEFFAMADSINNLANIGNILGIISDNPSWYAYSSEVDENGAYIRIDENGDVIFEESDGGVLYESLSELYDAVLTLDGFTSGEKYPLFDWEE